MNTTVIRLAFPNTIRGHQQEGGGMQARTVEGVYLRHRSHRLRLSPKHPIQLEPVIPNPPTHREHIIDTTTTYPVPRPLDPR